VIPTDGSGIATGASADAPNDGSVADAIAQLGVAPGSPDSVWSSFVVRLGVSSRSESQQASLAGLAAASASNLQLSTASVDVDEENVNLLSFQVAYQGAARVLTAVDQMLDTLINRTGIVGR
jgi:flagellar hook-associated protein 1 FlgK